MCTCLSFTYFLFMLATFQMTSFYVFSLFHWFWVKCEIVIIIIAQGNFVHPGLVKIDANHILKTLQGLFWNHHNTNFWKVFSYPIVSYPAGVSYPCGKLQILLSDAYKEEVKVQWKNTNSYLLELKNKKRNTFPST